MFLLILPFPIVFTPDDPPRPSRPKAGLGLVMMMMMMMIGDWRRWEPLTRLRNWSHKFTKFPANFETTFSKDFEATFKKIPPLAGAGCGDHYNMGSSCKKEYHLRQWQFSFFLFLRLLRFYVSGLSTITIILNYLYIKKTTELSWPWGAWGQFGDCVGIAILRKASWWWRWWCCRWCWWLWRCARS